MRVEKANIPTVTFLTASKAQGQAPYTSPGQAKSSVAHFWILNPSLKWIQAGEARLPAGYIVCRNSEYNSPYIGFGR